MKIIDLTFQNLNSIAGDPVHINFGSGSLAEAGIFAITGPTGAGKTTILDAITLALFGKAARYDEHKRAVPENMMSRGTGHCFSEVRFSAGDETYTARWDLQRARKKADGKVQAPKRQLADAAGTILETKLKAVDELVTEITGMDYPRFLRSVLLAQGRFREFLDAGEKERGDLLERITGTEIYSQLSKLAYDAAKEKEEALADARRAVAMLTLLTEEEKAGFTSEQTRLASEQETFLKALADLTKRLGVHEQWKVKNADKTRLKAETEAVAKAGETLTPDQVRLTRHEKAAPLESDLRLWESVCTAVKDLEADEVQLKKRLSESERAAAEALQQAQVSCSLQLKTNEVRIGKGTGKKENLETSIAKINAWKADHAADERLEAALPGVRSQLGGADRMAQEVKAAIKAEELTRTGIAGQQEALKRATEELTAAEASRAKAESAVKVLEKEMTAHPPAAELSRQQEALEARQRGVAELMLISADHAAALMAATALGTERKEKESAKTALVKEAVDTAASLEVARKTLTDKETIHQQAMAIESLVDKRAHLVDGEPCPLCGALEHPYTAGAGMLRCRETEAERDQAKKRVLKYESDEKNLAKRIANEESDLSGISASLKMKTAEVESLNRRYTALLTRVEIGIPIGDTARLKALESEIGAQLKMLCDRLKAVEALEKSRTAAEKVLLEARGNTAAKKAKAHQLDQTLNQLNAQLKGQSASKTTLETEFAKALDDSFKELSAWGIATSGTPDLASITKAVSSLESRATNWSEKVATLLRDSAELAKVNAGIETLTLQMNQIREEAAQWREKGGPFEALMEMPAPEAPNLLDTTARRELCEKALAQVARMTTQVTATEKQLQTKRSEEQVRQKALHQALTQSGFQDINELMGALLPPEMRTDITSRIEAHKDRKARLSALLKENDEALEDLALKQPPTEEEALGLAQEKESKERDRDELLKQVGEIAQKLKADATARLQQAKHIEQIDVLEKEARPWLLLKDLIGSADGTKFSRFAQGLTLGQLVALANRHLHTLNPRYEIRRIPTEDLGLEIVDRYQANAVRPTKSLSGGESFLVSLALALGLSEMAGQKTRIESLFIDEGFGSLDSDTLDTALAALENLRLENRTIGVISHVELLKNRIGAQIEVTRNADGHATLTVVDG